MKNWTAHELAKKLLELPDLIVWVSVNNGEGGHPTFDVGVHDSHYCYMDLDDAMGDERLYGEDEETPIYSPIIYLFGEGNEPYYPEIEPINFEI